MMYVQNVDAEKRVLGLTELGELQDTSWVRWIDSTTLNWKKSSTESNTGIKIRIAGIVEDSIADGPGLRFTIFAQGCIHNCKGCHNPETHALDGGFEVSIPDILERIDSNPLIDGVTLSGGDPFLQSKAFIALCEELKKRNLGIVAYTGFTWEKLIENEEYLKLVEYCDYVIDGKYDESLRSLLLPFKGSSNQRIIDAKKSMEGKQIIVLDEF